jgi:hypothetical protein
MPNARMQALPIRSRQELWAAAGARFEGVLDDGEMDRSN